MRERCGMDITSMVRRDAEGSGRSHCTSFELRCFGGFGSASNKDFPARPVYGLEAVASRIEDGVFTCVSSSAGK